LEHDAISRPAHYARAAIEPIDLLQALNLDYVESNVVKYVTRYRFKNKQVDLQKALQCLIWVYLEYRFEQEGINWTVNTKLPTGNKAPEFNLKLIEELEEFIDRETKHGKEEESY